MTRIATMAAAMVTMLAMACSSRGGGGGGGSGGTGGTGGTGGGGGTGGAPAGLDRSRTISTLTEAEKGEVCDWFAPMAGGYGAAPTCANWIVAAPPDKATCVGDDFPNCTATVGQFQDCVVAILAAQAVCTQAALTNAQSQPACVAVGLAGCFQ
jgi:hypothetical protein